MEAKRKLVGFDDLLEWEISKHGFKNEPQASGFGDWVDDKNDTKIGRVALF